MKKAFLFFISFLLIGCGVNTTPYLNNPVSTKVNLERANYRIVKQVDGYASAVYVFGIGGLSKKALEGNAVADMYKNAQLTGNQQIINITTTQSNKFILIYAKRQVLAHGIVIEFLDNNSSQTLPEPTSFAINQDSSLQEEVQHELTREEKIEIHHKKLVRVAKQFGQQKSMPFKAYERIYAAYTLREATEENLNNIEQIQNVMKKYLDGALPSDFSKAFTSDQSIEVSIAIFKQYI